MDVSGCSVVSIMPTNNIDTDVKSCGPGAPVLAPSATRGTRVVATR
jgi:hypothetical protein